MSSPVVLTNIESGTGQQTTTKPTRFYRPEIDVLRFFAFLLVFVCHTFPSASITYTRIGVPSWISTILASAPAGGAYGVDLFFALSAYLITTLLIVESAARGKIDIKAFYIRRILRIWPLYFVFLLAAPPIIAAFIPTSQFSLKYLIPFFLLSGNWACVYLGFPSSYLLVLWSVSVEEQFYLLWPIVMRRYFIHLPIIAGGLIALAIVVRVILVVGHASESQIWCNTFARLDAIGLGALLAWRLGGRMPVLSRPLRLALIVGGFAVFPLLGLFGEKFGLRALVSYPGAAIGSIALILGTLGISLPTIGSDVTKGLVYLGKISYGLYVFHGVTFQILLTVFQWRFCIPISLLVTIVLASLSYICLESPFLRLKEKFTYVRSRPIVG